MAKTKFLGASALTTLALMFASCSGPASDTADINVEAPAIPDASAVETLVTEATTRPGSELMAATQQTTSSSSPTVQEAKEFLEAAEIEAVSYTHLTLPTTPYV